MAEEIVVPQVGEAVSEVLLVQWFKQEGDTVQKGEPLFEVDTDKVTMDVEAFSDGVLERILVPDGSDVMPQQVVGLLGDGANASASTSDQQSGETGVADEEPAQNEADAPQPADGGRLSPVAQRMAQEMGLELSGQNGSGPGGRVMADDVRRLVQQQAQSPEASPTRVLASPKARRIAQELGVELGGLSGTGVDGLVRVRDVEAASTTSTRATGPAAPSRQAGQPLSKMRRAIAASTQASKQTVPHFYLSADVDMSQVQSLRGYCVDTLGWAKAPTYTDVLVRASALALAALPGCNVSLIDGQLVQRESADIGVAVSVADGLLTPVITVAERLSLGEVSSSLKDLTERARGNRLRQADLGGKSLVLSNLGMYAVDSFTAIIEQPAPLILAVGRISERVVAAAGQPAVRPMCTLTLSADHRVLDGVPAAQFLTRVVQNLEQPFALLGKAI